MKTSAHFLLSKKKVLEKYDELMKKADIVSYSYKTNKEVGIILKESTDCFFSVHSVDSVNQLSCPERIWYFSQGWDREEITEVFSLGIRNFVVDNIFDLDRLKEYLYEKKTKANLLLRMKLKEHTVHTGKHFVYGLYSQEVNRQIKELKEQDYISSLGIHFHRKTQNVSEWSILEELQESIDPELWEYISYVNIGGGLPSTYKNFRENVLKNIFESISDLKFFLNKKGIKMIIEPGRYIAAPSTKLVTYVKSIYENNIIVDASIFNSAMDTWISHIRLLVEGEKEIGDQFTIKGQTPDSADIFRYKVYLNRPNVGDKIIFTNAGAYNFSTDFCNLKKLETKVVD